MRSMTYLLTRSFKNQVKEIIKTPAKWITYLLGLAFVIFIVVSSFGAEIPMEPSNPGYLHAIIFGFFLFTFITSVWQGLSGTSDYKMEDVNLLFVSPIEPRTILLYGIIKSVKTVIIGSWFVLFQSSWMRTGFGVTFDGVLRLWLAYVVFAIACSFLSILIYAFTAGNKKRAQLAKIIIAAVLLPMLIVTAINAIDAALAGIIISVNSPIFTWTPLVGWASAGAFYFTMGQLGSAGLFIGLTLLFTIACVLIVYIFNPDFYEHVMGITQTSFSNIQDMASGDMQSMVNTTNRKINVTKTGVSGWGASAFFYKHLRESFRASRFGLWNFVSLFIIAAAVLWAVLNRANGDAGGGHLFSMMISFASIKLFRFGNNRGMVETYSHLIYMIPESPLKKWLYANLEGVFKDAVEALFIFIPAGIIMGSPIMMIVLCLINYIFFSYYYIGANSAFSRIERAFTKSIILQFLFLGLILLPLLPGVVLAVVLSGIISSTHAFIIGLLIFALWQLFVGTICFLLGKGALHDTDILSADYLLQYTK